MTDFSVLFEDLYGSSIPAEKAFEHDIVIPSVVETVIEHLARFRLCVITGRPRSGKTYIAYCVADRVLKREVRNIRRVRYLDLATIDDSSEDITYFNEDSFSDGWLLVVDNWHSRPWLHGRLNHLIDEQLDTGIRVLYCATRFEDDSAAWEMPRISRGPEFHIPIVDTKDSEEEVARGMIDVYVRSSERRSRPKRHCLDSTTDSSSVFEVEEEDYAQALTAFSEHKKIRGNLRFLHWRLASWNPSKGNLRSIQVEDVIKKFEDDKIVPNRNHLGTIAKIAAFAQWEIPFRAADTENAPEGVDDLVSSGVVAPVEIGRSWRMDSTDAYLFLLSQGRDRWMNITGNVFLEYLEKHPGRAYSIIHAILWQARWDAMTELATTLLGEEEILRAVANSVDEGVRNGTIRSYDAYRFVCSILRRLPDDEEEENRRVHMVKTILPGALGEHIGRSARGRGMNNLVWMLIFFRKHSEQFKEFISGYIREYGRDGIIERVAAISSGQSQRHFLRNLKIFDPELEQAIRKEVALKPGRRKKREFELYVSDLLSGVLSTKEERRQYVEALAEIDESSIVEFAEKGRGRADELQRLMQAAIWLSPDEARRIATLVPVVLAELSYRGTAKGWSFLLNNTFSANPVAAEDIVDYICTMRFGDFFSSGTESCEKMLVAMEKVQPGCVEHWIDGDERSLEEGLLGGVDRDIGDELVTLALFARDSVARVMGRFTAARRMSIAGRGDVFGRHVKSGALALCGVAMDESLPDGMDGPQAIDGRMPIQALAGLFSMNLHSRNAAGFDAYRRICEQVEKLPPAVILCLAKFDRYWNALDVGDAMRNLLRGKRSQREKGLTNVVVATSLLGSTRWPSGYRMSPFREGHRGIQTAIAEYILLYRVSSGTVEAGLNAEHPFVQATVKNLRRVLDALAADAMSLGEWNTSTGGSIPASVLDSIRAQLLSWRAVRPSVNITMDSCDILFRRSDVDVNEIYDYFKFPSQ